MVLAEKRDSCSVLQLTLELSHYFLEPSRRRVGDEKVIGQKQDTGDV